MCESTSSSDKKSLINTVNTNFNNDVIKEVLKTNFSSTKTKITDDAVELMAELTKSIVIESAVRAAKQTSTQNTTTVTLDHIEAALPQIMLDFP